LAEKFPGLGGRAVKKDRKVVKKTEKQHYYASSRGERKKYRKTA